MSFTRRSRKAADDCFSQQLDLTGCSSLNGRPDYMARGRSLLALTTRFYVVDSGRNRIVKFSPNGQVLASWGSEGTGDGRFRGVSSVAVDPINNKVYVSDPMNSRLQVFDSDGKVLSKWPVPEWAQPLGFEDLAINSSKIRLYASSAHMDFMLMFDLNSTRIGTVTPQPPNKLEGRQPWLCLTPSSMSFRMTPIA
jgi:DNA-binding beta-propeller fold protein YncE